MNKQIEIEHQTSKSAGNEPISTSIVQQSCLGGYLGDRRGSKELSDLPTWFVDGCSIQLYAKGRRITCHTSVEWPLTSVDNP
jgi:hypothetical protein